MMLASRLGHIRVPVGDANRNTVRDFIADLPSIGDGEAHPDDPVHITMPLSDLNKRRIQQSKPGGTWRDWDDSLLSPVTESRIIRLHMAVCAGTSMAPTITTQFCYYSTGRFGHPEQDRAISVREGALLQTFPIDYKFVEDGQPVVVRDAARQIGNAVPVRLAEAIGESIVEVCNAR